LLAKEVAATAPVHEVTRLIQFQRHPRQVRALPIRDGTVISSTTARPWTPTSPSSRDGSPGDRGLDRGARARVELISAGDHGFGRGAQPRLRVPPLGPGRLS
jgi:hypothetical protein